MTILYVQHDYAVFGFGETRQDAIVMAAQWLKDETGKEGCSVDYAESLLVTLPKPGQMTLYETDETIPSDAENWGERNCWTGITMWLEMSCVAENKIEKHFAYSNV
ncbi:MAG: hypothetical protein QX196_08050 [Methylococcaceae bacterium]